ncbi:MAG TPA: hypothetical protein VNY73_07780 [Bacteroidia bacterium]|jgi:hypothetical protein|nr:hypothetical protein [Bacteroidia bacterium]
MFLFSGTELAFMPEKVMEDVKTIKEVQYGHKKTDEFRLSALCNKVGLSVSFLLFSYFILMRALGLHEVLALRTLNVFFLLGGIVYALRTFSKATSAEHIDYFTGIKIGAHVTFVAVIPFTLFICLYLGNDAAFMQLVKSKIGMGEFLSPIIVSGALFIEGISSGLIMTFIAMQYFKK